MISLRQITRNSSVVTLPNRCHIFFSFESVLAVIYDSKCFVSKELLAKFRSTNLQLSSLLRELKIDQKEVRQVPSEEDMKKVIAIMEKTAYPSTSSGGSYSEEIPEERATFG